MPTRTEVQLTAYRLWEKRGCPEGTPETDWFEAERRLQNLERARAFAPVQPTVTPPPAEETTHLLLFCDESAAKGKANRDEQSAGQVGVFVGLLVPDDLLGLRSRFDALAGRYKEYLAPSSKLHLADLPSGQQEALRVEIFQLVRENNLPCFYEAIHVSGFHRAHNERLKHLPHQRNRAQPESLHVALFQGLYANVIAYCLERQRVTLHLEVVTDRIDSPIAREFTKVAKDFLNCSARVEAVTVYDRVLRRRVPVAEIRISADAATDIPVIVKSLDLVVVDDTEGLVLAADVIANSLAYMFHQRPPQELYQDLNCVDAVCHHPLAQCLNPFFNPPTYSFSDHMYAHPCRLPR